MSNTAPLPLPLAAHTVESLHATHGRPGRVIYGLLLCGVIAAVAALPVVEVDVSVSAPGVVRPATERVELRLPVAGKLARVLAAENERVAAGQAVLQVATPDLDERLERNAALVREKRALVACLENFSAARFADSVVLPEVAGERAAESFAGVRALRQDFAQLRAQWEASRIAEAKAGTELARAVALAEKGIATQRELDDARYALERVRADGRVLIEQARTRWQMRAEEEGVALATLASEATRLQAERDQAVLRAPLAGTLLGFVGYSPDVFVSAGQVVATVSPDDRLLVDAVVSTRDIGLVRAGQRVRMQVDAFPYTQWGLLEGEVVGVAADALSVGGRPTFKVTIQPQRSWLEQGNGARGALSKGMTVSARFLTARRTLLQILYQDASEWLDPQNRTTPTT